MNILFIILGSIAGIIALLLVIGLFSKKEYSLYREISINKPRATVFDYIKHIKNQDQYNKWTMMDPAMKKEFRGKDGEQGFVYAWDGNRRAGKGEQEIKKIDDGRRLDLEVRFERPFKAVAQTPFTIEDLPGNQTLVRWGMSSRMNYPMNLFLLFMNMEKALGPDLEESLLKLKKNLEE